MGWGAGIFGGVLVWAGFSDSPRFDMSDKWAIVVGGVFILAGLLHDALSRD